MRHKGVLDGFEIGRKEAEDMIMSARVLAGWITARRTSEDAEEAAAAGADAEAAPTPPPKPERRWTEAGGPSNWAQPSSNRC